jgi:serine/threonine protein kinase
MLRFGQLNILVLEYVEHEKDEYIYTMSVVQCQTYMKSLFTVLSHLEKRGIVHRDLKPQNFLSVSNKCL